MAVDDLSQKFLRVLIENGGQADTTEIRSETDMTRGQVTHRFSKLDDMDWIEIERSDSGKGDRTPPKLAVLTDKGEKAIKSGEAGTKVLEKKSDEKDEVSVSESQIKEFNQEIDSVKERLNLVVEKIDDSPNEVSKERKSSSENVDRVDKERVERLEREVSRLRETVELLNEAVSQNEQNSESQESESTTVSLDNETVQDLRDQQDYLKEWMDVAQNHMVAMRLYMQDNDEDFESYLEDAEDRS